MNSKKLEPLRYVKSLHSNSQIEDSLNLIKESFGDVDIAYQDYYKWQYLQNPVGNGTVLLAYDNNDHAVGQVACIPCNYHFFDQDFKITMTMNLCVSSKYRGSGLATTMMNNIHEFSPKTPISIGLPNKESMKAHLKNHYIHIALDFLIRPIHFSRYFHNILIMNVLKPFDIMWKKNSNAKISEYKENFDNRFNDLDSILNEKNKIRQIYTSDYLNWRYKNNPRKNYRMFLAEDSKGSVEGYSIISNTMFNGKKIGLMMNLCSINEKITSDLISESLKIFWKDGATLVLAVSFPGQNEKILQKKFFLKLPQKIRPHPFKIGMKLFENKPQFTNKIKQQKNWSFTFGDYETF